MKNSQAGYNFNNVLNYPVYPTDGHKNSKVCFLPVTNNGKRCENVKKSASPLKLKPTFLYEDYGETGVRN